MSNPRLALLAVAALMSLGCAGVVIPGGPAGDDIVEARATLKVFDDALAQPGVCSFLLKVAVSTEGGAGVDHMWIRDVVRTPTGYAGVLDGDPILAEGADGDQWVATRESVEDWSVNHDDGRIWGGRTYRSSLIGRVLLGDKLQPLDAAPDCQ